VEAKIVTSLPVGIECLFINSLAKAFVEGYAWDMEKITLDDSRIAALLQTKSDFVVGFVPVWSKALDSMLCKLIHNPVCQWLFRAHNS
jgi:hypothetical protein